MTEKEAIGIVRSQEQQLNFNQRMHTQNVSQEYAYVSAKAWLECFEQMKPIVEALEKIKTIKPEVRNGESIWSIYPGAPSYPERIAMQALQEFEKMRGE